MYTKNGTHLNFMVPSIQLAENAAEVLKEIDIGAASGTLGDFLVVRPCVVKRFQFTLSGEAASGTSVAPTVVFKKRPTPQSATNASTLCTLTIPSGTAIGATVYKDIADVALAVGDSVSISWTVGTGTPTGMGFQSMICMEDPEVPGNNSEMILSA